ncbi:hypothetical protein ACO2RV_12645 [Ancylobacter sp. VNQ12]|uniref:hypothetical protein n=1 Tax=Ancylobacter sp. VNQ12 TaxID=3400920 RepID=UPI003C0E74A0
MAERMVDFVQRLGQLRLRLDRAAAITASAQACAEQGAGRDAFQMILELDLDVLIGEARALLDALSVRSMDARLSG